VPSNKRNDSERTLIVSDLDSRIAELERQLVALKSEVGERDVVSDRRSMLRKAALGAAAAGAGVLAFPRSAAAVGGGGGTNLTDPSAITALTYTGVDLTTVSALSVGETVTATSAPVPLFPAAVGGYGAGAKIPNGLHGSTTAPGGSGVVAANVAETLAPTELGAAMTVATNAGIHINFVTLSTAIPSAPKAAGLLYKDKDGNLWFSIPSGTAATDPAVWQLIAGPARGLTFFPLTTSTRVIDTRPASKVPNNATVVVDVTKTTRGTASGVPANASAVLLNLTLDNTVGGGYHSAYSADLASPPTTSNINWDGPDQTRANLSVVRLGTGGKIKVTSGGTGSTNLIIDAIGYYS
jgi:hypothetical protein